MKLFLKRTCLFYAYNTLAIFAGMLAGGIPTLLLRTVIQPDAFGSDVISGVIDTLCVMSILIFLMHRDTYERRVFSFKSVILPAITVCFIRWMLWYVSSGKAAFWVTGSSIFLSPILFPSIDFEFLSEEAVYYKLISTIIYDVLVTIPVFIGAGYWGYKHRINENKKMTKEHEAQKT